jgi:hypothetical protein
LIAAMSVDHIRYDLLVRQALRDVVHRVLVDVAKNGLPGDHHFYISFDTRAPGVKLSPRMRTQYPEEMTIVLQHQFWDLIVGETALEVGLSFGGIPERLTVPFDAFKGFFDPSVQFGLEFEVAAEAAAGSSADSAPALPAAPSAAPPPTITKKGARGKSAAPPPSPSPAGAEAETAPVKQDGMGEVVSLDRFRKK